MMRGRAWCLLVLLLLAPLLQAAPPEVVSHGRFETLRVYRPAAAPTSVALLFSGAQGWNIDSDGMARTLVAQQALVIGIDLPPLLQTLASDGDACVLPAGDLDNLSRFVQAYAQLRDYRAPVLVGYEAGGALAYAALSQAGTGTFAGAVALAFEPQLPLLKPLCAGKALQVKVGPQGNGLQANRTLGDPLRILQGERDRAHPPAALRAFVGETRGAQLITVAAADGTLRPWGPWQVALRQAYAPLAAAARTVPAVVAADVADLPLVEVTATGEGAALAILISGDGGWAGLDKDIAAALARHGVPVVGLDSLRYFWRARTPDGLAQDLHRVIQHYLQRWHKREVWLLGYSQGADVLPFALNRLPADSAAKVRLAVPMAIGTQAAFEFHLSNWIGRSGTDATAPELARLADDPRVLLICSDDDESGCAGLDRAHHRIVVLPGGHHFNGDYPRLAQVILAAGRR